MLASFPRWWHGKVRKGTWGVCLAYYCLCLVNMRRFGVVMTVSRVFFRLSSHCQKEQFLGQWGFGWHCVILPKLNCLLQYTCLFVVAKFNVLNRGAARRQLLRSTTTMLRISSTTTTPNRNLHSDKTCTSLSTCPKEKSYLGIPSPFRHGTQTLPALYQRTTSVAVRH